MGMLSLLQRNDMLVFEIILYNYQLHVTTWVILAEKESICKQRRQTCYIYLLDTVINPQYTYEVNEFLLLGLRF